MTSSTETILPTIGAALGGGFYAGNIKLEDQVFALVIAPKLAGETANVSWIDGFSFATDALSSNDGLANTKAMAAAGSGTAAWALGLSIDGNADWYLPSQDELEIIYRNLKPTADRNAAYMRSGVNLSAVVPTRPYSAEAPTQTSVETFQAGAAEAFDNTWYWSSTVYGADYLHAWAQSFFDGSQVNATTELRFAMRAIRKIAIS